MKITLKWICLLRDQEENTTALMNTTHQLLWKENKSNFYYYKANFYYRADFYYLLTRLTTDVFMVT